MGIIILGQEFDGKHGKAYRDCYACVKGNISHVKIEKPVVHFVLVASLFIYPDLECKKKGGEPLEVMSVRVVNPSGDPNVIVEPYTQIYDEVKKMFPSHEDC